MSINNIDPSSLESFLEVERRDCQYFWHAGRLRRPRFEGQQQMWKSERQKVLFYKMFDVFLRCHTISKQNQSKDILDKT